MDELAVSSTEALRNEMKHAVLRSGTSGLCLTICAIAASIGPGHAAANPLGADRTAILQAVLNDARARWHGSLPCISDHLISMGEGRHRPQRISRFAGLKSPFALCHSIGAHDRYLAVSEPAKKGGAAVVALNYHCPVCGQGTLYSLQKRNGRWGVVARERSWVS